MNMRGSRSKPNTRNSRSDRTFLMSQTNWLKRAGPRSFSPSVRKVCIDSPSVERTSASARRRICVAYSCSKASVSSLTVGAFPARLLTRSMIGMTGVTSLPENMTLQLAPIFRLLTDNESPDTQSMLIIMSETATMQSSVARLARQVVTPTPQSAGRGTGRGYTCLGGRERGNGGRCGWTNGTRPSGANRPSGASIATSWPN